MLNFIIFISVVFVVLKIIVSKNNQFLLRVNPYIQTIIAFPITFALVILLPKNLLIGIIIYVVTMYLGLLFQEYYQKLSFKGEGC